MFVYFNFELKVKPTKKSNCTRSKRKHGKSSGGGGSGSGSGGGGGEETITKGRTASPGDPQLEEECASGVKLSGKVAIPRLNNRSPRPSSAILILPTQQSISPTISKPKFVPIQPKPCENGTSLPQLKEDLEGAGAIFDLTRKLLVALKLFDFETRPSRIVYEVRTFLEILESVLNAFKCI